MANLNENIQKFILRFSGLSFKITDIIEIIILSFFIYQCMRWIKRTRAWTLLKGLVILLVFLILANFFKMNTILWITENIVRFGMTALIIVFQPELRKGLESLGQKRLISSLLPFDSNREVIGLFSDKTVNEIIRAVDEMAKVKTGALIVIEQDILLTEYERTGIEIDSLVSTQLLINIFEHNTPLHDGAIIIRGNRIAAATCYLPLSDNLGLSKDLGTRHRAAVGISEVTDSLTIIISEETGSVSLALKGQLIRDVEADELRNNLIMVQNRIKDEKKFKRWKGRPKDEKNMVE